jgi:hypothetical protein
MLQKSQDGIKHAIIRSIHNTLRAPIAIQQKFRII